MSGRAKDGLAAEARAAQGKDARDDVIVASYRLAFARDPQPGEVQHWKGRGDWSTSEDLVKRHRDYIQASAPVREEVIRNSYGWSFGRAATGDEVKYWSGRRDWGVGRDLNRNHLVYIRANSPAMNEVIDRAFTSVLKRAPKAGESDTWRGRIRQYDLTYTEVGLALILENLPELQRPPRS